jgi:hypothetical protein
MNESEYYAGEFNESDLDGRCQVPKRRRCASQ